MTKLALCLVATSLGMLFLAPAVCAQTKGTAVDLELDFDALFEWKKPSTLNAEQLEARLAKLETVPGKKVYFLDKTSTFHQPSQLFTLTSKNSYKFKFITFGSIEFVPSSVRVMWNDNGRIAYFGVSYPAQDGEKEAAPALLASIGEAVGAPAFSLSDAGYTWSGEYYDVSASFTRSNDDTIFFVTVRPKNQGPEPAAAAATINFDDFFEWKKPTMLTQDLLASKIAPLEKTAGTKLYRPMKMEEGPEFWFSTKWSLPATPTYSIFGSQFRPTLVRVLWLDGLADKVTVFFDAQKDEAFPPQMLADMDSSLGAPHSFNTLLKHYEWNWPGYTADACYTTAVGKGASTFLIHVKRMHQSGTATPVAAVTPPAMLPSEKPVAPDVAEIKLNLDSFIDWKTPMNLTVETFDAGLKALESEAGSSLCRVESRLGEELRFFDPSRTARAATVKYSILEGQYHLTYAFMHWKQGKLITIEMGALKTAAGQEIEPLQTMFKLDKMFGRSHAVEADYAYTWSTPEFLATLIKYPSRPGYGFRFEQPRNSPVVAGNMPPASTTPVAPPAAVEPTRNFDRQNFVLDLDPLVDWNNPFSLVPGKVDVLFKSVIDKTGGPLWTHFTESESTSFGTGRYDVAKTLFAGRLKIQSARVIWREPRTIELSTSEGVSATDEAWLYDKLDEVLKVTRRSMVMGDTATAGHTWRPEKFRVMTLKYSTSAIRITITRPTGFDPEGPTAPLAANLDALLNFSAFWTWTVGDFEKSYTPKAAKKQDQTHPQQFEWLSASKDRARFSRQMDSNVETKLTMFGGSIKLEEAVVEFVNGRAARATISFYNRGDSGDIEVKEFDRIFKLIGQSLSQVLKVAPKRQIMSSNAALPVTGWMWSSPNGIALLEYNEYNTPGKLTKPEFLRLKLAAPNQADWSMGKMVTGVQRMELVKRVTKTPEGDVYITGVPMVDQGQKGYCVAASCQRLFEYMRIPCDQHEMAKLVNVDAESGANIMTMQKSLGKIDTAFKVTFKPFINPELYYSANRKRRVSEKEFLSIVKENVEKGIPLLWGLMIGDKPEEPPLSRQTSGGHMRLVIGYNLAKNQILFTDSWGAGHELKRMALIDAYDVTMGLYSMAPRGL